MPTRRQFLAQTAAAGVIAAASAQGAQAAQKKRKGPLKLAIVGTGQISLRYLKQAVGNERAHFVATCARTLEEAKARAVEFGIEAWFDDYKTMYDKVKPDAVVVATPTAVHAEMTIAALERGIHVLCEKPMGMNYEQCKAMVAAAQKSGAVYLNMPYDANPQTLAALEHLNEDTLGVFTGAEAQLLLPGVSRNNWYYDRKVAGGGAGLDTLVYPVSRLISLFGPARRVTGSINTLIPHRILGDGKTIDVLPPPRDATKGNTVESTVDDNATLVIEWPTGQQGIVRALWGTSIVSNTTTIYGRHGTMWMSGKDLIIHSPERAIPGATPTTWGAYKECYSVPVKELKNEGLVDHFVDCILGLAQPTCGGQQALHVHEILFKGYEAASSGRTQDLETTFTPWHKIDPAFHDTRSRLI